MLALALPPEVPTLFAEVAPPQDEPAFRMPEHDRAIVLIHGLRLQPGSGAHEPAFQEWQQAGSTLVRVLSEDSDVFSFAYAEDVPLETIAEQPPLDTDVLMLKELGYREIVLVGHSAGGLVARQYVEDHPDSGVTGVIQVCSPNAGTRLGEIGSNLKSFAGEEAFLTSLSEDWRGAVAKRRADRTIPKECAFVCVLGDEVVGAAGDFVLGVETQWPADLRAQGIPSVKVHTTHLTAMRSRRVAETIASLVKEKASRWEPERVDSERKKLH